MDTEFDTPRATGIERRPAEHVQNLRPVWISGPEDIVVDDQTGWAYVSSQARAVGMVSTPPLQGAIYGVDLNKEEPQPVNLTAPLFTAEFKGEVGEKVKSTSSQQQTEEKKSTPEKQPLTRTRPLGAFHPGGLHLYTGDDGSKHLFVINLRSTGHATVEIFGFDSDSNDLTHKQTITDDEFLTDPNEVVAISADRFYVTNQRGFKSALFQAVEFMLHLPVSNVVFYDGTCFVTAADELSYPNGITIDRKAGKVFLSSVLDKKLLVADWKEAVWKKDDWKDNEKHEYQKLHFTREISLPSAPDNLEWDVDGNLWVGAQDIRAMTGLLLGRRTTAPSAVLRVSKSELDKLDAPKTREDDTPKPEAKTIWSDDGTRLSTSSVARVYKRADGQKLLLIGACFDDRMLIGDLI